MRVFVCVGVECALRLRNDGHLVHFIFCLSFFLMLECIGKITPRLSTAGFCLFVNKATRKNN